MTAPTLSTVAACQIARLDRDRFNEHSAAGRFPCAPETVPGRARLFDPDDMLALWLFREIMDDGIDAVRAGQMACAVAGVARENPEARAVCFVQGYFGSRGTAMLPEQVPPADRWDDTPFPLLGHGIDIRKVSTFRIGKTRELIAQYTAERLSGH